MATGSSQSKALVSAEWERRGIRRVLYFVLLLGIVGIFLGHPAGPIAGPICSTVALAGLAASCRPVAV